MPRIPNALMILFLSLLNHSSLSVAAQELETPTPAPAPLVAVPIDDATLTAGALHTCAIHLLSPNDFGGEVYCWGINSLGQCNAPAGSFIQVSAGRFHTCGIHLSGNLQCWGNNAEDNVPVGSFTQVSSGDFHTCAVTNDKSVVCWGFNSDGQSTVPSDVLLSEVIQVSAGRAHTCVMFQSGSATCWGAKAQGQSAAPTATFAQLSASPGDFTCGLTTAGYIQCWGSNSHGQLDAPANVAVFQLSTSRLGGCALTQQDQTLICWGVREAVSSALPRLTAFDELTLAWNHGCGFTTVGGVVCWGAYTGQRLAIPSVLL